MARPKLVFSRCPAGKIAAAPASVNDYRIYATYRRTGSGGFMGDLKVVRTVDDRVIFPFDGAPSIGPFQIAADAREAAKCKGHEIVAADLANPER